MAALLREFPGVRVTFNLVPSLLIQIQAFANGCAKDRHLDVGLKPAEHLEPEERSFLVANGFHAPFERMIKPYPRYAELHTRRRSPELFAPDEVRDLQVLHKLAWMDPDYLERDRRLLALVAKQRGYSEEDKEILRAVELELLNAVIPVYREASSTGQVELSTSPFYHPILPLLCNLDVHLERHPDSSLARGVFARPHDAIEQLRRASGFHRELFGDSPAGVWPSEGSLSGDVVEMLSALGVRWTATDEDILARTLERAITAEALYRCYEVGTPGRTLRCLFRDHRLSDLIGFTYQSWDANAAAADFIEHVRDAGRRFAAELPKGRSGEVPTVTVILDGENAWEHYENGGRPFLRALYRQLENATDIRTVTMSEAAAAPARRLEAIAAGSWINADFYVWAGHPDDHRAWRQLAAARAALDQHASEVTPEDTACALEELLIAEGSDWFWWYGDDRSSDHDREFDELFRRHLRNMYRRLGQAPPDELFVTNITTDRRAGGPVRMRHLMTPAIDGVETGILEWSSAVWIPGGGGTMHRATSGLIQDVLVGADRSALFFRMRGGNFAARLASGELEVCLLIDRPVRRKFRLGQDLAAGPRLAAAAVVEIAIPLATIGVQAGDCVSLAFLVSDAAGQVLEQFPESPREIAIPDRHLEARGWLI